MKSILQLVVQCFIFSFCICNNSWANNNTNTPLAVSRLSAPSLRSPKDSTQVTVNNIILTWNAVKGAANYQIALRVGSKGSWSGSKWQKSTSAKIKTQLVDKIIYWKVRARSANGRVVSGWSRIRLFMIKKACVTKVLYAPTSTLPADPEPHGYTDIVDRTIMIETSSDTCSWQINPPPPSWITFPDGRSGTGSDYIRIGIEDNTGTTGRNASFTVDGIPINIFQSYGSIVNRWNLSFGCGSIPFGVHDMRINSDGSLTIDGSPGTWVTTLPAVSLDAKIGGKYFYFTGSASMTLHMSGTMECPNPSGGGYLQSVWSADAWRVSAF